MILDVQENFMAPALYSVWSVKYTVWLNSIFKYIAVLRIFQDHD